MRAINFGRRNVNYGGATKSSSDRHACTTTKTLIASKHKHVYQQHNQRDMSAVAAEPFTRNDEVASSEAPPPGVVVGLITDTLSGFSIQDDIHALSRAHEALQAKRTQQQRERLDSRADIFRLSQELDKERNLLQAEKESVQVDHSTLMNALDRKKFGLAKGINELETEIHVLESKLTKAQAEMAGLPEDVTKMVDADFDAMAAFKVMFNEGFGFKLNGRNRAYNEVIVTADGQDPRIVKLYQENTTQELWDSCFRGTNQLDKTITTTPE